MTEIRGSLYSPEVADVLAALERATGPDRAIDDALYLLAGFCLHKQSDLTYSGAQSDTGFNCVCGANSWGARGKQGERLHDRAKPYTSSIDAALTLYRQKPGRVPTDAIVACVEALKQWR